MSFSFLAFSTIAISVVILGPIIAHMAKHKPNVDKPYGAMMLLKRVVKKVKRRRRLRDLPLLFIRIAALLFVVLTAMKPELIVPDTAIHSDQVVFIVDNSMSMSLETEKGTLLEQARSQAAKLLRDLPDQTKIGVISGNIQSPGFVSKGQALELIDQISPTWSETDLAFQIDQARLLLVEKPGEVLIFTDEAGPGVVDSANNAVYNLVESGSTLIPMVFRGKKGNAAIKKVNYGEGVEGGTLKVEIEAYGTVEEELLITVTLPDDTVLRAFTDLKENSNLAFTIPPSVPGGIAKVQIEGDALKLDNTFSFYLSRVGASGVLVVDGDPGPTPIMSEVYFLERALSPWGNLSQLVPKIITPAGLQHLDRQKHQVVFLANVSEPRPYGSLLSEFVRAGGNLIITSGANVTADRYNSAFSEILPAPLRRVRDLVPLDAKRGISLLLPEVTGLFEPFQRRGRLGFRKIATRRIIGLEPFTEDENVKTLLTLEGDIPWLVEKRTGSGRVLFLATSIDLAWSNFPLQSVFIPFIQRMVSWLGGDVGSVSDKNGIVDSPVCIPSPSGNLQLIDPLGQQKPVITKGGETCFTPIMPGGHQLSMVEGPLLFSIAVNTSINESDVQHYSSLGEYQSQLDPMLLKRKISLGWWTLVVSLLLFALQSIFGTKNA